MKGPERLAPDFTFRDIKVPVYYDETSTNWSSVWRMKNPDSITPGVVYMPYQSVFIEPTPVIDMKSSELKGSFTRFKVMNGSREYNSPEYAPQKYEDNSTPEDREMLPRFIIVNKRLLDDNDTEIINKELDYQYNRRNRTPINNKQ